MDILEEIVQAIVGGQKNKIAELTKNALNQGIKPLLIINRGLIAGMDVVGPKFKKSEMFIPEVLQSAEAMHLGMEVLKPLIIDKTTLSRSPIVLGTVEGDLHDIGKNIVGMLLEGGGFNVVDLGVNVLAEKFVDMAKEHGARIIAMSALLTTTMPAMREVIDILEEDGLRDKFKVIIGGAPVNQAFCDRIKADGYAPDAVGALDLCRQLVHREH